MLQLKTKKIKYKCGHNSKPIVMDDCELSLSIYLKWKNTVGFKGDGSKCWECYCKNRGRKWKKKKNNQKR